MKIASDIPLVINANTPTPRLINSAIYIVVLYDALFKYASNSLISLLIPNTGRMGAAVVDTVNLNNSLRC